MLCLGLCGGLALIVFGWVACVLGLLRVKRSMETKKAEEEMLEEVRTLSSFKAMS